MATTHDLARFAPWARMIERASFSPADKAALTFKAWARFCSTRCGGIVLELGRVSR